MSVREEGETEAQEAELQSTITDIALVLEGGGTKAAYSAGAVVQLLQQGIYFDYVCGISAGASHAIDYLSRDIPRTKMGFVDILESPESYGVRYFVQGKGYFNAEYLYEEVAQPDAEFPFDYETFRRNPAECRIGAFDVDEGIHYFSKRDMTDLTRTLKIVRASSSMPMLMPMTEIDGHHYVDGGLSGGIPLDIAIEDGYEKFFIILTKPRGYRLTPLNPWALAALKLRYASHPRVYEAWARRSEVYNATLERALQLEREGRALIVYAENIASNSVETNLSILEENFRRGYAQSLHELPRWREFLGL